MNTGITGNSVSVSTRVGAGAPSSPTKVIPTHGLPPDHDGMNGARRPVRRPAPGSFQNRDVGSGHYSPVYAGPIATYLKNFGWRTEDAYH